MTLILSDPNWPDLYEVTPIIVEIITVELNKGRCGEIECRGIIGWGVNGSEHLQWHIIKKKFLESFINYYQCHQIGWV